MENYKKQFIEFMLESGVLTFGDFTTKSGRKTPYFINTGNYKTGSQITKLGEFYAECIYSNLGKKVDVLYGPAYKGIPLAVTTASSLYRKYQIDVPFCFNRKEAKDHGEGGNIIGYLPQENEQITIIEDVVTAGTAVRESLALLKNITKATVNALIVSVDRMERGTGDKSTLDELRESLGIETYAIVNIEEIISYLYNREINGKVFLDDELMERVRKYREEYGV
ncbi:MAG TPA: orotate phosphoribosyltransferase [Bacillota bacterium]|jgi:orotate phosphoribosyltransferase|nr:orotate phosphoribosyltransferase [Bacillota bacterium]HOL08939.1 orotate phosphoribosyltransferase [Bacillota bacterium]HPO96507.1 orotate phosphoribosyltransferase [Bacillota bacterium]